jgi:acetyl esterase/lipase
MWVHGGGWRGGSHQNKSAPKWLAARGIAVASIEQRPITEIGWPAQISDPRDALAWLRAHAMMFGLDSKRFGVWGASSGGHIAALLGTTHDPVHGEASAVQAVCDWFGPTDLLTMPPNMLGYGADIQRVRTHDDIASSNGAVMLGRTVRVRSISVATLDHSLTKSS